MAAGTFDSMLPGTARKAQHCPAVRAFAEAARLYFLYSAETQYKFCFDRIPKLQKHFVLGAPLVNISGKCPEYRQNDYNPEQPADNHRLCKIIHNK